MIHNCHRGIDPNIHAPTQTHHATPHDTTDLSKRKSGGPKEKEKDKKEEEDPNKSEDDHPFRLGALFWGVLRGGVAVCSACFCVWGWGGDGGKKVTLPA